MNMEHAQVAMQIIMHAGDARTETMKALRALKEFDIDKAKGHLAGAKEYLVKAHNVQTSELQAEAEGKEIEYSMLFSHAQDTCMTVYSEMNIAEHLTDVCEKIDERFKALERQQ